MKPGRSITTTAPPTGPGPVKSCGIWIRVSTEDQAHGESPEHHLARAKAYAASKGWDVKEVYDLAGQKGWSGKSVKEHPECRRMLADIERRHITALIFSKLARLARNTRELLDFADTFRAQGADLVSLQESVDTSTPAGRLFYTVIAAMAQWEREEIADRVNASLSVRAKLGKPLGGPAPYGYEWKDRKLVVNPTEAPIRRRAYELFRENHRKGLVAKLLNESGYRTRGGFKWSNITVGRVIQCPSAKGIYHLNKSHKLGSWHHELKPEHEWGTFQVEPIVSAELWAICNQILEEQTKANRRPGRKPVQLFAGLAFCACGQKMYVKSNSPKYVCQRCLNKIPIVDLEAIIHEELKVFFMSPERVASKLAEADQSLADKTELLENHRREVTKVREEMSRMHRLYLDGNITGQGFGEFYKPAEERLNQLLSELPVLEAEVDRLKVDNLSVEEVVAEAERLYRQWPTLVPDDKRKIVESIIERITIGNGEIDIKFSYLPTSEEMVNSEQALPPRSARVRRR